MDKSEVNHPNKSSDRIRKNFKILNENCKRREKLAAFVDYKGSISEWHPESNANQNNECERKLIQRGKYQTSMTNYALSDLTNSKSSKDNYPNITLIKYLKTKIALEVNGKGKDRLEAVCDACINFNKLILTEPLMKDL